jgi:hypothetical protein
VNLLIPKNVAKFTLVNVKNIVQSSLKIQSAQATVLLKLSKPPLDVDVLKRNVCVENNIASMKILNIQSDTNGTKTTMSACHAAVTKTVLPLVKISEPSDNAAVSIKTTFVQKVNNSFTKKNSPLPVANITLANASESNVKKPSQNTTHTDFAPPVTNQKPKLSMNAVPNKLVFVTPNNADS